ncbi:Parkinson disease protein 7 -like protein [Halotydeus destructor]|nr:Parkinson disease protein 7 -like protein [Halotydeus destructor]
MAKTALVIIADGTEEMEAVITIDVLRRGGIEVTVAGLESSNPVKCSHGIVITPDVALADAKDNFDIVVLPGGLGGSNSFAASDAVKKILEQQEKADRAIGAICAAPIALKSHGIALKKRITSHPSKAEVMKSGDYVYSEDRVVVDGQLITSRGAGTAFEFALAIVEKLVGKEKVDEISPPMVL